MAEKTIPPSISETAFNCPYCGAFTTQSWLSVHANDIESESRTPFIPTEIFKSSIIADKNMTPGEKESFLDYCEKINSGLIFFVKDSGYVINCVQNVFLSKCYNCAKIAVWVHDKLLFPPERYGEQPSSELPENVLHDYEEARSILNLSPRGAAALLRLCVHSIGKFIFYH
jgi:hypothetical protein